MATRPAARRTFLRPLRSRAADPALLERVFTVAGRNLARAACSSCSLPSSMSGATRAGAASRKPTAKTPISSASWESQRARLSGTQPAASPGSRVRDAQAHDRPRPARERYQRRAGQHLRAQFCARSSSRRSAAVERGNAQAVMPSYNEIDGVPSHVNRCCRTCCAAKWASKARSSATTSRSRS